MQLPIRTEQAGDQKHALKVRTPSLSNHDAAHWDNASRVAATMARMLQSQIDDLNATRNMLAQFEKSTDADEAMLTALRNRLNEIYGLNHTAAVLAQSGNAVSYRPTTRQLLGDIVDHAILIPAVHQATWRDELDDISVVDMGNMLGVALSVLYFEWYPHTAHTQQIKQVLVKRIANMVTLSIPLTGNFRDLSCIKCGCVDPVMFQRCVLSESQPESIQAAAASLAIFILRIHGGDTNWFMHQGQLYIHIGLPIARTARAVA